LQHFLICCGRLDQFRERREGHDANLRGGLLALNERQRSILGSQQAVGLNICRTHAPRNVNSEHDDSLAGGHAHNRHRAHQGKYQAGQRQQEEGKREVTPQA